MSEDFTPVPVTSTEEETNIKVKQEETPETTPETEEATDATVDEVIEELTPETATLTFEEQQALNTAIFIKQRNPRA